VVDGFDLFVARDAATWLADDGTPRMVRPGTVVRSGHPYMTARPDLFEPLVIEVAFEDDLELSTARVLVVGSDAAGAAFEHGRAGLHLATVRTRAPAPVA
jgi:hypothetical protein